MTLLSKYFNEFIKKHYEKVQRQLGVDSDDVQANHHTNYTAYAEARRGFWKRE